QLHRSIKLHFKNAYNLIVASTSFATDNNPYFEAALVRIYDDKIANDWSNELWDLHREIDYPLDIALPYYYHTQEKPAAQPFDPRFTIAVYLHHLALDPSEVPFHWSDWVDVSRLNKYILNPKKVSDACTSLFDIRSDKQLVDGSTVRDPTHYCTNDADFALGYRIHQFAGQQTENNHEILGKSYLYSTAPSPLKLVFLTNDKGSYTVDVQDPDKPSLQHSLLQNGMIEQMLDQNVLRTSQPLNVQKAYTALTSLRPLPDTPQMTEHQVKIPEEAFNVNPYKIIADFESAPEPLSRSHQAYLDSVRNSVANRDPPKFFYEAKLLQLVSNNWRGEHYDWRFFNGITIGDDQHLVTLHRLLKNYLHFARTHNLKTWIAHGSLLSWYWNGIAFPWDTDVDVQMPIEDLYKLAQDFNQTLVVENAASADGSFDGMGRYFVDVGSSISHRTKGNGRNNIDARFIDIDTGLYIDITGLALTDTPVPDRLKYLANATSGTTTTASIKAYNCRNMHYNTYDELSPLVMTVVENQVGYVPSNFIVALNAEYSPRAMTELFHRDHFYNFHLRMWMPTQTVSDYMTLAEQWLHMRNSTLNNPRVMGEIRTRDFKLAQLKSLGLDDHINLLQDNGFFGEYYKTKQFTWLHQQEMTLLLDPHGQPQAHANLLKRYSPGTGLKPDVFMDLVMRDMKKFSYSTRMNEILALSSLY
ncbi:uncharacterized protein CANTADRAFT_42865, partial [Suhomyces tanzawaensis NRRL Y-17324]